MGIIYIQDAPTPHASKLIETETAGKEVIEFYTDYFVNKNVYDVKINKAWKIYHSKLDIKFIKEILKAQKDTKIILVGWYNINTKILAILLPLIRKDLVIFIDLPTPYSSYKTKFFRRILFSFFRLTNVKFWALGKITFTYLTDMGIKDELIECKVFFEIEHIQKLALNSKKYNHLKKQKITMVTGGRIDYFKGMDILLSVISELPVDVKSKVSLCLFADEVSRLQLQEKILELDLNNVVTVFGFVGLEEYLSVISSVDLLIQPSRYDAFGAAAYAYALGKPIIGTNTSGAVIEYVKHKKNGIVYEANDKTHLNKILIDLVKSPAVLKQLKLHAKKILEKV